jgi:hypothetical protein
LTRAGLYYYNKVRYDYLERAGYGLGKRTTLMAVQMAYYRNLPGIFSPDNNGDIQ